MNDTKMSKRKGRLADIACERGESIDSLVPRIVAESGSIRAAATQLGVADNTIRHHLKRLGYKPKFVQSVIWERDDADQEKEHVLETAHA